MWLCGHLVPLCWGIGTSAPLCVYLSCCINTLKLLNWFVRQHLTLWLSYNSSPLHSCKGGIFESYSSLMWPASSFPISQHRSGFINCESVRPQTRCVFVDRHGIDLQSQTHGGGLSGHLHRSERARLDRCDLPAGVIVRRRTRCTHWEITITSLLSGKSRPAHPLLHHCLHLFSLLSSLTLSSYLLPLFFLTPTLHPYPFSFPSSSSIYSSSS